MTKDEIRALISAQIAGQGMQLDAGGVLPSILNAIIDLDPSESIGDLASLLTDHKSDIVSAINELADLVETTHYVVSLSSTAADLKAIYDAVSENEVLAKNIVFSNTEDGINYLTNGYKLGEDVLTLHTIMQGEEGLSDVLVNITSAGIISIG